MWTRKRVASLKLFYRGIGLSATYVLPKWCMHLHCTFCFGIAYPKSVCFESGCSCFTFDAIYVYWAYVGVVVFVASFFLYLSITLSLSVTQTLLFNFYHILFVVHMVLFFSFLHFNSTFFGITTKISTCSLFWNCDMKVTSTLKSTTFIQSLSTFDWLIKLHIWYFIYTINKSLICICFKSISL